MRLCTIYVMIYFVLLLGTFIIHGQTSTSNDTNFCNICIIDSKCTDDKISFNISVSKYCHQPLSTHFTYHTDVHPKPHHYNTTITCSDCYISIEIDPIHEAWNYILTLIVPRPSNTCPHQHVAYCEGHTSRIGWLILGGLSGLGIVLGLLLCYVKQNFGQRGRVIVKRKKMKVTTMNS